VYGAIRSSLVSALTGNSSLVASITTGEQTAAVTITISQLANMTELQQAAAVKQFVEAAGLGVNGSTTLGDLINHSFTVSVTTSTVGYTQARTYSYTVSFEAAS
jgi:flagellar hook assembly protein FlgD